MPRALLERYTFHHLMLQAVRLPIDFQPSVPASVLVLPLKEPTPVEAQFDFRDSYQLLTISMRLGSVGFIGALQDGGAQRTGFFGYLSKYQRVPLHPLQFSELTAKFFYKASLFNRVPTFLLSGSRDHIDVIQLPLSGFNREPLFDEWSQADFAFRLARFLGVLLEEVYRPPDQVRSWLDTPDGEVRDLTFEDQPWPLE